jgi:hypothetical protein
MCELYQFVGGHLSQDDTHVKPLQQDLVLRHLVVPDATLDNELEPKNDADVLQDVYFRYGIVEPADACVRQIHKYKIYLQSAILRVWLLDNEPPPARL